MSQPVTVYFDTYFFVRLGQAHEANAAQVVSALNALNVRYVASDLILRELLTSKGREDFNNALVERLGLFHNLPLRIHEWADFTVLSETGPVRSATADVLNQIHDKLTEADSAAIMARKSLNKERSEEVLRVAKESLKEHGFPDDMQGELRQTIEALKNLIPQDLIPLEGITWPENPTEEDLKELSNQLLSLIDPSALARSQQEDKIKYLATRTDNRPFRVFTGAAKDLESRKLGNTLRDVTRISDFITHKDTIDFLQVDHGQMKLILSPNPTHRPLELELARCCFYARSLFDTVRQLRYLHRVRSKV